MNPKLILIAGHSATGKSTFAHQLSHALGILNFSKDTLKEAMGNGFGVESRVMHDKDNTAATINIMVHIAECFLRLKQPCILEANFRPPQDAQIQALLEKYDAHCLTFLFGGDMDVLWQRYKQRENERHWVHKTILQDRDRFVNGGIKAGFGEFCKGRTIHVDATDFSTVDYNGLIETARQFVV
ncbi:MAG: ATP-binding protein [Defluviitaleaceae bacterium]|nr:ATP-binding protein [Defluviitaleaceae bacterium]MCL2275798.1 ATP-binding protein [Defluviitaleaceae bacterium]